jgi:hypothetical protein
MPGIHIFVNFGEKDVDGRVKPGRDRNSYCSRWMLLSLITWPQRAISDFII